MVSREILDPHERTDIKPQMPIAHCPLDCHLFPWHVLLVQRKSRGEVPVAQANPLQSRGEKEEGELNTRA